MAEWKSGRKYYRIKPGTPLYADMCIVQVGEKEVRSRSAKVSICDISQGGLSFSTSLNFPLWTRIILEFAISFQGENLILNGYLVHKENMDGAGFRYGVCFTDVDEFSRQCLVRILRRLTLYNGRIVLVLRM